MSVVQPRNVAPAMPLIPAMQQSKTSGVAEYNPMSIPPRGIATMSAFLGGWNSLQRRKPSLDLHPYRGGWAEPVVFEVVHLNRHRVAS